MPREHSEVHLNTASSPTTIPPRLGCDGVMACTPHSTVMCSFNRSGAGKFGASARFKAPYIIGRMVGC